MTDELSEAAREALSRIDVNVAHPARVWDYWLGGKDHYAADREVGDQLLAILPDLEVFARADREFLGRAVRYMAREAGIRQFLDIGTGIPTANNTHEVAQSVAPDSRVVYVDNDPIVLVHAQALLRSTSEGATDYIDADLRDPDVILEKAARTLDFGKPIGLTLLGIVEFLTDDDELIAILDRLLGAMPSGSHLAIAHPTLDIDPEGMGEVERFWNENGSTPAKFRSREEFSRLFNGLELIEPGVVSLSKWRPEPDTLYTDRDLGFFCAVGRKP